ncbi:MAG: ATP-binding protein [Pseudomonadota bacterium]
MARVGAVSALVMAVLLSVSGGGLAFSAVPLALLAGALGAWSLVKRPAASDPQTSVGLLQERCEMQADQIWQLEEIASHYRSAVDALGDVVIRQDSDGTVVFVNDCYPVVFGRPRADVLGRRLSIPGLDQKQSIDDEAICLRTADGHRWFARTDTQIRFDGLAAPLRQTVLRDVTDQRKAEQALIATRDAAEAASDAKSRFLATVSHEIRTPLNGILGMTGLLLDTELTSEQTTYARAVRTSGRALLSLIDDVLDLSKIEAGHLDLQPEPTALETLLEDLVELLAPRAHAKNIEIGVYVASAVPGCVNVDGDRLRQVLLNLAGNAIKFTERGGVALTCSCVSEGGDRVRLAFAISDTGIGIEQKDQSRIFGEFEQADHGPTRRFDGYGLGLAISRRIVRRMGGDITVESRKGQGTSFSFSLDLPVLRPTPVERPPLKGARIAIVSDAAIEAGLMLGHFTDWGARAEIVDPAVKGPECWDAVFIDLDSVDHPVETLGRFRDGRERPVPGAVLVRPTDRPELDRLRSGGFDGYLVKPVRRASLLQVGAWLTGRGEDPRALEGSTFSEEKTSTQADRPLSTLLVEDNPINALLARALLEKMGHTVTHVDDGAAAIAAVEADFLAEETTYDCLIMDLHMPGVDGREAIRRIRSLESKNAAPSRPIIALTADMMAQTRAETLALGADAVLTKPVEEDRLRQILDEVVPPP